MRRLQYWMDNWHVIFRPICWLRGKHNFLPIGIMRRECTICWKRQQWSKFEGKIYWQ